MKTKLLLSAAFCFVFLVQHSYAQIEISPTVGYQFNGKIKGYYGEGRVSDNVNFGISGNVYLPIKDALFEVTYIRHSNTLELYDYREGEVYDRMKVNSDYILMGLMYQQEMGNVKPYGGLGIGLGIFTPKTGQLTNTSYSAVTRFTATLTGGVKVMLTDVVGLKFQGRLIVPMQFSGVGIGCGIGTGGSGCGASMNTYSSVLQGDLGGGVVINIDTKK